MSPQAIGVATFSSGPEDPLALLPRTPIREYEKNQVIYRSGDRNESLYLVIEGCVKVNRLAEGRREVVLDFCHRDDFFGETAFLGANHCGEQATALDKTALMHWTVAELKRLVLRTPALGPALLGVLAQKLSDTNNRIESFCVDPINRRLVKVLLHLARPFSAPAEDQKLHMPAITHEQLGRYVGTSREIVTQHMNQFRRDNLLNYSRRGIDLDVSGLQRYLYGPVSPPDLHRNHIESSVGSPLETEARMYKPAC